MTTSSPCRHRLASALALVLFGSLPAQAVTKPEASGARGEPLDMLDARVNLKSAYLSATSARPDALASGYGVAQQQAASAMAAARSLGRLLPGLDVRLSSLTGAPESVLAKGGPLTGPAPGQRSEDIVRGFLGRYGNLYGLSNSDLGDLVALGDSDGGRSGLRMLRMEQQIDGRPVFQSETRFLLDRQGRLHKSTGQLVPGARSRVVAFDPAQLISAPDAVVRLLASAGKPASAASFSISGSREDWIELAEDDGYVVGPVAAREVLFPLAPGMLVPAWSLVVFTGEGQDWYAVVDAQTGDLLWRKNIRNNVSDHDARFRVYVQADGVTPADSPAPHSPSSAVPGAGTQFPEISASIVSMHAAMDPLASPNGWINDCPAGGCTADETQTLGNNVLACLDRTGASNANVCDTDAASVLDGNGRPTGNPDGNARDRDFFGTSPRDFQTGYLPPPQAADPEAGQTASGAGASGTAAVDQFRRGMVTQLFYVSNWYHDQLFALGFDEAAANFQATNFSGMGLGGDRVLADAQDSSGTNNANFSTPPDGVSGRMQMYRFTGPTVDRDGSLDTEIVIHELTHGTSNRLVGNGAGLNWEPGRGLGEGWSDFYALALLNGTQADDPDASYAAGGYATYKLGGLLDNYVYAIRRFPYSTNNSVNPLTWGDADDVTNSLAGGIAPSPLDFNGGGAMEVHNTGELWALSLWEVRSRIIADPAGANGSVPVGNQTMLQLVTDGMKMTPINPSFVDARDALIDADCATNACANEDAIWAGFADRGLGYGARSPFGFGFGYSAGHTALGESFLPPHLDVVAPATDVVIDDGASNGNGVIDPGEAVRLSVALSNPWRRANKGVTLVSATLSSSTPGVTIHQGSATWGAIAAQGKASGSPFVIAVDPSVPCGSAIDFTLTTTSSLGTSSANFRIRVGAADGTGPVRTYTGDPTPDLAIPDNSPRGVFHQLTITDDVEIADLDFRVDSLSHTFTGDLSVLLRSPDGIGNDVISLIGGLSDGGPGDNMVNMLVDDDLPVIAGNDMVQATSAAAPYTRSWLPVFNAPWSSLAGFGAPDPVGSLSRFDGASTAGTWRVLVSDQFGGDTGSLNAWSMLVTPVNFSCAASVSTVAVTASKTVAGTLRVGSTVTYTVVLRNDGNSSQLDNPGNEFTDVLPAGLSLVSATASSGTVVANAGSNTVSWNGSLAPLGGTATITITATVNAGTQGSTISNQGSLAFDADGNGSNESSGVTDDPGLGGSSDPTAFVVGFADVSASKTVAGSFLPNQLITYTVVLSNSGNAVASDVPGNEFTDALPTSLSLVSANASSGTLSAIGDTLYWNGAIAAGGNETITLVARIAGDASGSIANQASIRFDADLNGSSDTTRLSDDPTVAGSADPTVFSLTGADLQISKSNGTSGVIAGKDTVYTIQVGNGGPLAVTGARVVDLLPIGLSNPQWTCSAVGTSCPTAGSSGNIDVLVNLPLNAVITFEVVAQVSGTLGANISNTATVTPPAGMPELDSSDNSATDTDVIVPVGIFYNGFEPLGNGKLSNPPSAKWAPASPAED